MSRCRKESTADLQSVQSLVEAASTTDFNEIRSEVDFTLPPLVFLRELTFSFRPEASMPNQMPRTKPYTNQTTSRKTGDTDESRRQEPAFFTSAKVLPQILQERRLMEENQHPASSTNISEGHTKLNSSLELTRSIKSLSALLKVRRSNAKLVKADSNDGTASLVTDCLSHNTSSSSHSARPTLSKSKTFSGFPRHEKPLSTQRRNDDRRNSGLPEAEIPRENRIVVVGHSVLWQNRSISRHHQQTVENPPTSEDEENLATTPAPPPPPSPDSVFPPLRLPTAVEKSNATCAKIRCKVLSVCGEHHTTWSVLCRPADCSATSKTQHWKKEKCKDMKTRITQTQINGWMKGQMNRWMAEQMRRSGVVVRSVPHNRRVMGLNLPQNHCMATLDKVLIHTCLASQIQIY